MAKSLFWCTFTIMTTKKQILIILSKYLIIYMGGISQDVKRLKMWDFYPLFFGFS